MTHRALSALFVAAALLWLAPTSPAAEEPVTMSVALEHPDAPASVGEPLALAITIKNNTGKPVKVLDWEHFDQELVTAVKYFSYPGTTDDKPQLEMTQWPFSVTPLKNDYRELPPGNTVLHRSLLPMLPGKAMAGARWDSPSDMWQSSTTGKIQTWDNAYRAKTVNFLQVSVSAEPSPAMKKHYEDVQRKLDDPIIPPDQKGQLLNIVGSEKHYFAAKFLREYAEKQPAGPLRDAAVWQLLLLAKVGTAYEAIPLLLARMTDVNTNQETRVAILDWAAATLAGGARMSLAGQAEYVWPEALKKQAREALQKATADPNPYLASRAKDALRKLDEK